MVATYKFMRVLKRGLLALLVYSITYGFFEYTYFTLWGPPYKEVGAVTNGFFPSPYHYWAVFILAAFLVVFIACRSFEFSALSAVLFTANQDLFYFVGQWIHTGVYPFPVPNWYDHAFPLLGVFQGGVAIPFPPFFPRYYFMIWLPFIAYVLLGLKNTRLSRAIAWSTVAFFTVIASSGLLVLFGS